MIVVAIIAILVAVAVPQYHQMTLNAHRMDIKTTLWGFQKAQEAYFASHDHYLTREFYSGAIPHTQQCRDIMTQLGLSFSLIGGEITRKFGWQINLINHAYVSAGFNNCLAGANRPGCGYHVKASNNIDGDPTRDEFWLFVNDKGYSPPLYIQGEPMHLSDDRYF